MIPITDKKILVPGGNSYSTPVIGLSKHITTNEKEFFDDPDSFSLILFTGGADVNPALYGETSPDGLCGFSPYRDVFEAKIFNLALEHGIKMTGICRGAQFINVMSGGKLMHHIENHGWSNHEFICANSDMPEILVNSLHHQMIIPPEDGYTIGWCHPNLSKIYVGDKDELAIWDKPETEAVFIPRTQCAGVQYHPEMMPRESQGFQFYRQMVVNLLMMNMDEFKLTYMGNIQQQVQI